MTSSETATASTASLGPGAAPTPELESFLKPLRIDADLVHRLALDLCDTFTELAAQSDDQFLPTPISESILSHPADNSSGPHLAIDIGGTNLRVAFVELNHFQAGHQDVAQGKEQSPPIRRHIEHSWPIGLHLKDEKAEELFNWIGACIAEVVAKGTAQLGLDPAAELPLGVTFSFPMDQQALDKATLRSMGKGFAITSSLDLGKHLVNGYENSRGKLPRLRIAAITNDAVATLLSFMHQFRPQASPPQATTAHTVVVHRRPAMGLICGTGCNATVFMELGSLKESKRPMKVQTLPGEAGAGADGDHGDVSIAVNTEWSINGSEGPLRAHGLISRWDDELSAAVEKPGFQPLEYMTAGRYLGELGRLVFVDYMTNVLGLRPETFPPKLLESLDPGNTTFLSHFGPEGSGWSVAEDMLNDKFPPASATSSSSTPEFRWTEEQARALHHIARTIEYRAAGIVAASTVGLLRCSGALPSALELASRSERPTEVQLGVGYTGGCITNFQDYLPHCRLLIDDLVDRESGGSGGSSGSHVRIVLEPCHDGGIDGAGILVPAAVASGI